MNRKTKPEWNNWQRFEHSKSFNLNESTEKIFPLLCPVLEYEWLPNWNCSICYSESGVAEKNAIFTTKEVLGKTIVWTNITYEPARLIEYLLVNGTSAVIRLSIRLESLTQGTTSLHWTMQFSMTKGVIASILSKKYSKEKFDEMIAYNEKHLEYYLKNKKLLN